LGSRKLILLDTHCLFWWVNDGGDRLSADALAAIADERPDGDILISSITSWEIAMLVARGRLGLSMDIATWLATVQEIEEVEFVPIDNAIALEAVALPPEFHKDPADRLIVATARILGVPIVTADEKIRDYPHVRTIW
jgi:PIN domain nuclease of toxin-antitoxin system